MREQMQELAERTWTREVLRASSFLGLLRVPRLPCLVAMVWMKKTAMYLGLIRSKGQGVAPINQRHFPLISLPTKINLGRPRLKRELHSKRKRKSLAKRR